MLADLLVGRFRGRKPVVVALPRGGVPVGLALAKRLDTKLEILITRKLGAPEQPEYAIGAVTEFGHVWFNPEAVSALGLGPDEIDEIVEREMGNISQQRDLFRGDRPAPDLKGHTLILVDDGLATGSTMLAAVRSARAQGAVRVLVATPVASVEAVSLLRKIADDVLAVQVPERLSSVGQWYEDFAQVSDDEVSRLLASRREAA
jgi:predicted phosphoribosyltransferase